MRLPWPFRRSAPDRRMSAVSADGFVQRLAAPVRHDWRTAGTLAPSFVGDPGIRYQRFPAEIAGSQVPPAILAPLGHARTADGPAGLVSGLSSPTLAPTVAGAVGRADLPLRAIRAARNVQRSSAGDPADADVRLVAPGLSAGPVAAPALPVAAPALPVIAPALPVTAPAPDADVALPLLEPRRVPVAAAPAPPRVGSFVVATTPDLTLVPNRARAAERSVAAHLPEEGGAALATSVPVVGAASREPTRTILRTASGTRVRLGAPVQRAELAIGAPPLQVARPGPRGTAIQPVPSAPTSSRRHAALEADDGANASLPQAPDAPMAGGLPMTLQGEPMAPRSAATETSPAIPGGLVLARTVAMAADARPVDRPSLMGERGDRRPPAPLVGGASVPGGRLRPTIPAPDAGPTSVAEGRPHAGAVSGQRPAAQRSTSARPTAWAGPSSTIPARGVARRPGPGAPERRIGPSVRTADVSMPSSLAPATGTDGRLTLARSVVSMVADANEPGPGARPELGLAGRATIQRAADDPTSTEGYAAEPASSASSPYSAGSDGASGAAVARSPAGTPAGVATMADRDLDEVARRLYPRLRRSLSSELLVARERAGTLADLR